MAPCPETCNAQHSSHTETPPMTDVTPPPAPPTTPVWEDILDIFISPSTVFERRKEDPTFFLPWIIFVAVIAALVIGGWGILEPVMHADQMRAVERAIASHPDLPPNIVEAMRSGNTPGAGIAKFIVPIAAAVVVLLVGLVTWLGGRVVGATTTLAQGMMVAAYAYFPKILDGIASLVLAIALPDSMLNTAGHLKLGPSMFLDPDRTPLVLTAVVTRLDLFTLWTTVLLALGLKVTGKLTTQKAVIAGIVIWCIGALLPVLGALRAG